MAEKNSRKTLDEYNRIFKENDEIYREAAKKLGLSDCAFWILYAVRSSEDVLTQSDLCYSQYQPKQTINSALKKLEREGYLILRCEDNRRSKQIYLTQKGTGLAENTVDKVIFAEVEALSGLTMAEQQEFLKLFRKYTDCLKEKIQHVYLSKGD